MDHWPWSSITMFCCLQKKRHCKNCCFWKSMIKKKRERERESCTVGMCAAWSYQEAAGSRERERERRHTDGGSLRLRACTVRKSTHTASLYDVKSVSCSAHSRLDPNRVLYLHARGTRQPRPRRLRQKQTSKTIRLDSFSAQLYKS